MWVIISKEQQSDLLPWLHKWSNLDTYHFLFWIILLYLVLKNEPTIEDNQCKEHKILYLPGNDKIHLTDKYAINKKYWLTFKDQLSFLSNQWHISDVMYASFHIACTCIVYIIISDVCLSDNIWYIIC